MIKMIIPPIRVQELREEIRKHEHLYYVKSEPEISDIKFDEMMVELIEFEKQHPELIDENSPTQRVGESCTDGFEKVTHTTPMMSIENTYTYEDVQSFHDKNVEIVGEDVHYFIQPKIDGVAVSLQYRDGVLEKAVTRGDGNVGDDVTQNIKTIRSVPLVLLKPFTGFLDVRCEAYISKTNFEILNKERVAGGKTKFANARNAASGSLKLLDPKEVSKRRLDLFVHSVGYMDTDYESDGSLNSYIQQLGFVVVPHYSAESHDTIIQALKDWGERIHTLDFEADGIVVKVDLIHQRKKIGSTSKHPKWVIAYKYNSEEARTILTDIEFCVGRTGVITPKAILEPVWLDGTTIKHATLHNFEEIRRKDIRIGDMVVIQKGGEIIPKVSSVITSCRNGTEVKCEPPNECPCCGEPVTNDGIEVAYRCRNSSCPNQLKKALEHFVQRSAMNIDGFGEMLVSSLVDNNLVSSLSDIYYLDFDEVSGLERMGKRSTQKLFDGIEKSKTLPLNKILYSLGLRHTGRHVSKILMNKYSSIWDLKDAPLEELTSLEDIGETVSESIKTFFGDENNVDGLKLMEQAGVVLSQEMGEEDGGDSLGCFKDKKIVITGTLAMNRDHLKEMIESSGGKVSSAISKKTDFLICGEKAGSKLTKANTLGIMIVSELELIKMIKR